MSFPYTLATLTIPDGAAVSGQVFIGSGVLVGIVMDPTGWTTAPLTFLVSADGVNFYELMDQSGDTPVSVATPTAASVIGIVDFDNFRTALYVQLQSGTSAEQVNQGAARTLTLVVDKSLAGGF